MQEKFEVASIMTESSNTTQQSQTQKLNKQREKKLLSYLERKKQNRRPINIVAAKNLPDYFFICFLIIFCAQMIKFVPEFGKIADRYPKYQLIVQNKNSIKFFSGFLAELDIFSKMGIIIQNITLFAIVISLLSVIKKISLSIVKDKISHMLIYFCVGVYTSSLMGLTFYDKQFKDLSKSIHLIDNMLFPIYIISSYLLALLIHFEVNRVNINGQLGGYKTENSEIFHNNLKVFSIFLMGLQAILYILSVLLVSYYNPITKTEKFLEFGLIVCVNVNSIMMPLTFAFYVFLLKTDLTSAILTLEYRQNEYYIDIDEDTKNML